MRRIGVLAMAGYAVLVGSAMVTFSPNLLLPAVQLPLLFWLTSAIARRIAARTGDQTHFALLIGAFQAKMIGTLLRTAINDLFYNGLTDALDYSRWGAQLAPSYRVLDFSPSVGKIQGTGFMRLVTGVAYSFWGDSVLGASLLFSWLAFIGLVLFWLAFRRGIPQGMDRRYALLIFFVPSMLYWPSALGKDAFAVFLIGAISYGLARLMTGRLLSGLLVALVCSYGVMLLRPHVALTVASGALVALAFGRSKGSAARGNLLRIVGFCLLALVSMVLVSRAQSFFGVKSLDGDSISQTLDSTSERTSGEAGSVFTPIRMDNPVTALPAIITVIFRPFPLEARNLVGMIASLEGVFLMFLTFKSRRGLARLLGAMRESPYVGYSLGMSLAFVFAFSSFSNFGILARQRVQMWPLLFVLLCVGQGRGSAVTEPTAEECVDGAPPWRSTAVVRQANGQDPRAEQRFFYEEGLGTVELDSNAQRSPSYSWSAGQSSSHELAIGNQHRTDLLIMPVAPLDDPLKQFAWESGTSSYKWSSEPQLPENRGSSRSRPEVANEEVDERTSTDPKTEDPALPPVPGGSRVEPPIQRDVLVAGEPYLHTVRVRYPDGASCDLSEHTFRVESVLGESPARQFESYESDGTRAVSGVVSFALSGSETARLASDGERIRVVLVGDIEGIAQTLLVLDLAFDGGVQLTEAIGDVDGLGLEEIDDPQIVTQETWSKDPLDDAEARFFAVLPAAEVEPEAGDDGLRVRDREDPSEPALLAEIAPTVPATAQMDAVSWFENPPTIDDDLLPS